MPLTHRKNSHLLWRAGFGPAAEGLNQLHRLSPQDLYAALKQASAPKPEALTVSDDYIKGLVRGIQEEGARRQMDKDGIMATTTDRNTQSLNVQWLEEMVHSPAQLREKMAFFWHGHFASRNLNVHFQQQLLHILRHHALGSFREMLHEASKSAAVLFFLNAAQNVKAQPNENFAREVMELFTLGRGHYTEQDVKEAARAFTGWGASLQGNFTFRKAQHDAGSKTVLGISGNLTGEQVLDILLAQKQTALFITTKVYRFFVNEKVDATKVQWLADRFFNSDYNIGQLMDDIFLSDWFYEEKNIGSRIKSPIELLVGIRRLLPMELQNPEGQTSLQRLLGQVLFMPPNVAGWPGGTAWIDSSKLMYRLRLPQWLAGKDDMNVAAKTDDDVMPAAKRSNVKKPFELEANWYAYASNYNGVGRTELVESIANTVLQVKPSFPTALLNNYVDARSREAFIQSATLQLLSTPEYQLC